MLYVVYVGSYDCTAKVWRRDDWQLLHTITLHADSVWDLKIHGDAFATAGLDGTVGMFDIGSSSHAEYDIAIRFLIHVCMYVWID